MTSTELALAPSPMPVLADAMANDAVIKKKLAVVEKRFGKATIHRASDSVPINHLPFLQPNLNRITEGGLAWGRTSAFYGDESTGKTRLAYELIMQGQQLPHSAEIVLEPRIAYHVVHADNKDLGDPIRKAHAYMAKRLQDELDWIRAVFPHGADCMYYNAEQQFDKLYAKKIGIDIDRLVIVQSQVIEEIVEIMRAFYEHCPMHIVDSTSHASSNLMLKEEVGKSLMAVDSRQWKSCLKGSMPFFDPARNMNILIHQMSTNLRTGGAQPVSSKFLKHTSSCSIKLTKGKFLYETKDGILKDELPPAAADNALAMPEADGLEVYAKVEKSRTCRPHRSAHMHWDYKSLSYVPIHEVAASAIHFGYIEKSGTWFKVAGQEKTFGQGMKAVYAFLEENRDFAQNVVARQMDYTAEIA